MIPNYKEIKKIYVEFRVVNNTSKHAYVLNRHFNFQIFPGIVKSLIYT